MTEPDAAAIDREARKEYESGTLYNPARICTKIADHSREYADRLLARKMNLLAAHCHGGRVVDLCCATGEHLFAMADRVDLGLGLDFSSLFVRQAERSRYRLGLGNLRFTCANARQLPLSDGSIDVLYSFSALYVIPNVDQIIKEIARVLRPGGRCVLDLGNSSSLNSLCVKFYPELPKSFHFPVARLRGLCEAAGLSIAEHRAFQILPMWADRPRWLWPLLHPGWKRLLAARVGGRMIDEWVSNLPLVKRYAFRHLLVCEKRP